MTKGEGQRRRTHRCGSGSIHANGVSGTFQIRAETGWWERRALVRPPIHGSGQMRSANKRRYMKVIPKFYHGVLDYMSGVLLLIGPNIFAFADGGGAVAWVPRI